MQCEHPFRLLKNIDLAKYPQGIDVPCGQCLLCRIARRKEWSMRMLHELDRYEDSVFLTLTYNDTNLPENASLRRTDLQKFWKRLRKQLDREGRKIRYFACGEYGSQTQRPHYHAIVYGLSLRRQDKQLVMDCWPFCDWNPAIIKGSFGLVEADSIRYVAQYIDKKYTGDLAETEYTLKGREPVFKVQSLGIGKTWALQNAQQIKQQGYISLYGVKHRIPRYYAQKLGIPPELTAEKAEQAELDTVEALTGERMSRDEYYLTHGSKDVMQMESSILKSRRQNSLNIQAKASLKDKSRL